MNSNGNLAALEEYANQRMRFKKSCFESLDFREMYIKVLTQKGYSEDDTFFIDYMFNVDTAEQRAAIYTRTHSFEYALVQFQSNLRRLYLQYDEREPDFAVYKAETVLLVVMLSSMCGNHTCKEHASFWFEFNPILQYLVPNMPSPKYMISAETVRFILKLIPNDAFEPFFKQYFSFPKHIQQDLENMFSDEEFRPLCGCDGEETRASFRRGCLSRKKKAGNRVSIYNCSDRCVIDYDIVAKKNNETKAIMKMIANGASIPNDAIICADAINARASLIDFLNERNIDWLFSLKTNLGNGKLYDAMEQYFGSNKDDYFKEYKVNKTGNRIEEREILIAPADKLALAKDNLQPELKSIIKIIKTTHPHLRDDNKNVADGVIKPRKPTTTVLYYISSLEYNEHNCKQLVHSLQERWLYETQHYILDTAFLQDQQQVCDDNHLASIIGLNSMTLNVLTYAREKMSKSGHTNVKHRNAQTAATAKPLSYKATMQRMKSCITLAFQYLFEYLTAEPK